MIPVSDALIDLLNRQKAREGLAGPVARGMKERAAASDGADSQSRQGEEPVDLNSGKGRAVNAPAKFTGLKLVWSNRCLGTAIPTRLPRAAVLKHLVLVSSR